MQSTYDIKEGQRAKFVIDTFINIPIRLHKIEENYLLWEALPHRDTTRIQEGEKGDIIFKERFLITYRFTTQIAQTFKYKNELLFKIPHSSNLQLLAKRKYPRVDVNIEGVVRKVGKLRSNLFINVKFVTSQKVVLKSAYQALLSRKKIDSFFASKSIMKILKQNLMSNLRLLTMAKRVTG